MENTSSLKTHLLEIRGENLGGYKSAKARGLPYYGSLPIIYPKHFSSWKNMHKRVKSKNLECSFAHTANGFVRFLRYIGDIPEGMKNPTLGREDHAVGYVKGNFSWQEKSDNSIESSKRNCVKTRVGSVQHERHEVKKKRLSRLRDIFLVKGNLSSEDVIKTLKVGNKLAHGRMSLLIKTGKLRAEIVGTRSSENWCVRAY